MAEHDDEQAARKPLTLFNKWLRTTREERGLTQTELGRLTGLEQSEISKWERGTLGNPPPEKARKFASALGVPYEQVWGVIGGQWPDGEALPAVVKEGREVIPEFVRLLNLRLSPQEADFLGEVVQLQRRYTAGSLRAPGGEPGDTGTKDVPGDR